MVIRFVESSPPVYIRVLRLPADCLRPHLIELELIREVAPGNSSPWLPNVLTFWGEQGWEHKTMGIFVNPNQRAPGLALYTTQYRGEENQFLENKHISHLKGLGDVWGDAFLIGIARTPGTVPDGVLYFDLDSNMLKSELVEYLKWRHDKFGDSDIDDD